MLGLFLCYSKFLRQFEHRWNDTQKYNTVVIFSTSFYIWDILFQLDFAFCMELRSDTFWCSSSSLESLFVLNNSLKWSGNCVQSFYSFCQNIDLSSLQLALTEKNSQLPDLSCCGLPAVLGDPDPDVRYIILYNSYHRSPEVTFINNVHVKGINGLQCKLCCGCCSILNVHLYKLYYFVGYISSLMSCSIHVQYILWL